MSGSAADGNREDESPSGVDELQASIEETRADLARTTQALSAKLDVKSQARRRLDAVGDRTQEALDQATERAPVPVRRTVARIEEDPRLAAAAVVGLVILVQLRRRRRRRVRAAAEAAPAYRRVGRNGDVA